MNSDLKEIWRAEWADWNRTSSSRHNLSSSVDWEIPPGWFPSCAACVAGVIKSIYRAFWLISYSSFPWSALWCIGSALTTAHSSLCSFDLWCSNQEQMRESGRCLISSPARRNEPFKRSGDDLNPTGIVIIPSVVCRSLAGGVSQVQNMCCPPFGWLLKATTSLRHF